MAKILSMNEMLLAATRSNMPGAQQFVQQYEELTQVLAQELAAHLGVEEPRNVSFEDAFDDSGGVLGGFAPHTAGQACPEVLLPFDTTADWEPREATAARNGSQTPREVGR